MGRKRRWSDQELREAVAGLYSMRSVLLKLGLRPLGGNYGTLRRRIAILGLSTSHWLGQGWLRGKHCQLHPFRPLEDILKAGTSYQSAKLKRRLIKSRLLEAACGRCLNRTWLDQPIPLELDHIDGDTSNNLLSNLRLLCPNCHAQTPTYRAKNAKYPHIPALAEIELGIQEAGGVAAYARRRGVSAGCVHGWRRSHRLRTEAKVGENDCD